MLFEHDVLFAELIWGLPFISRMPDQRPDGK